MSEDDYFTNPNTRCKYCQGRAVLKIVGGRVKESNLLFRGTHWECSDKKECEQNQLAEKTQVDILFEGNKIVGKRVSVAGKLISEVIKQDDADTQRAI